jgi:hypothetical protein
MLKNQSPGSNWQALPRRHKQQAADHNGKRSAIGMPLTNCPTSPRATSLAVPSPASPVAAEFRLMGIEGQIVR